MELESYRRCCSCDELQPIFKFSGSWRVCKTCDKVRKKEKVNKAHSFVLKYLRDHPCVDCGCTDVSVLVFDHLRDKKKILSYFIKLGYCIETIKEEISKCEVRCSNCHAKKNSIEQNWYKKGP